MVYTIGHSTRLLAEFIRILQDFGLTLLADVRTMPRSRHNPQFNKETLPKDLGPAGLGYVHLPGLGGLRKTRPDSPNRGWRSPAFRGFADYMQTLEFEAQLSGLLELARKEPTAVMCAEAVPWRCHRSLIADALTVREVRVEHILGLGKSQPHRLTPFAEVAGTRLSYPPEETREPRGKSG